MTRLCALSVLVAALVVTPRLHAQNETPLTRDEVGQIKKKLVNAFDALGQAPAGYSVEHENYNLPTDAYKIQKSGLYQLLSPSADRSYGTQMKAEQANKDMEKEFQKKFADAQAKGDYAEIAKLSQEMQKKSGEMQQKNLQGQKEPIQVNVRFNSNPYATIDPDAVFFEHPGVIALKTKDESAPARVRIAVYFDPVALKDTKQLSKVDLKQPEDGVKNRTAVLIATIEMAGPQTEVEAWAKKIDVKKVLAQIGGGI